jgi:hypothetical protein
MKFTKEHRMNARKAIILAVAIGAGWGMAGCATSPVPNEKIAVAQAEIARAEQAGATQTASVPLAGAREKLVEAQRAAAAGNGILAGQMADRADVDAQLAEATAIQQKSHQSAAEFDQSMQALQQEAMRPAQPAQ